MPRKIPGAEIELLVRVKAEEAKKRLKEVEKAITSLKPAAQATLKGMAFLFGWVQGKLNIMQRWIKHFGQTLKSAVFRTIAYGIINVIRGAIREVRKSIEEAQKVGLNIGRAAVIMTRGGEDFTKTYKELKKQAYYTGNAIMLNTRQIGKLSIDLAKGGLKLNEYRQFLELLSRAHAITGEDVSSMALDILRLARTFGISQDQWEEFIDSIIVGVTSTTGTLKTLVSGISNVGYAMAMAYGKGMKPAKEYISAIMAMSAVAVEGGKGARWLRRALLEIMAPASATIGLLTEYGVEVYEATDASRKYAEELKAASRRIMDYKKELGRLYDLERIARKRRDKERLAEIQERKAELEDAIESEKKFAEETFRYFIRAGGKIKYPSEIVKAFLDLVKTGKVSRQELALLYRDIANIRGAGGLGTLTAQFETFQNIMNQLNESMGKSKEMVEKLMQTWEAQTEALTNALDKLRTSIADSFGVAVLGPINKLIRKYVIDPVSKWITENDELNKSLEKLRAQVEKTFKPVLEDVGKLLTEYLDSVAKGESKEQREKRLAPIRERLAQRIRPVVNLIKEQLTKAAREIGRAFWEIIFETGVDVARKQPGIIGWIGKQLGPEARIRRLMLPSPLLHTREEWEKFRQYTAYALKGEFKKIPEKYRERYEYAMRLAARYKLHPYLEKAGPFGLFAVLKFKGLPEAQEKIKDATEEVAERFMGYSAETVELLKSIEQRLQWTTENILKIRKQLAMSESKSAR